MTLVGWYESEGSMGAFYVIDYERGFKEFIDKEEAEYAHGVQSMLSKFDLAPYVYSEVGMIRCSNGELSSWGYITEIAEIIGCGGNECQYDDEAECDCHTTKYNKRIEKLCHKISDTGIGVEFVDSHIGNVGFVRRRGRKVLVCIDFGSESVHV